MIYSTRHLTVITESERVFIVLLTVFEEEFRLLKCFITEQFNPSKTMRLFFNWNGDGPKFCVSCHQSVERVAHTYQHKFALCREKN